MKALPLRRAWGHGLAVAAILGLIGGWLHLRRQPATEAEQFPARPIEVVVPYSAGGGTDTLARLVQRAISRDHLLPQPMVINNLEGGSGTIGSRQVKNAHPDGYVILCMDEGVITSKLSGMVTFGPEEFQPIAQATQNTPVVVVREDAPFADLPALLAQARAAPNSLRFGVPLGTPPHFTAKELQLSSPGSEFNFIQSMGAQKRYALLLGGHIDVAILALAEILAYRAAPGGPPDRQIRPLAVLLPARHPALPDVPTATEFGCEVSGANGLYFWAPKGTPPDRVAILATAIGAAIATPDLQKELKMLSIDANFRQDTVLENWIADRTKALSRVAFSSRISLPNLPLYTSVLLALLGLALRVFPPGGDRKSRALEPAAAAGGRAALLSAAVVLSYIGMLSAAVVPYAITTSVMVFLVGAIVAGWRRPQLPILAELALLTGFGADLLFTQVFHLILP